MKNKFYMLAAMMFAFSASVNAQVVPTTADAVALPTSGCPTPGILMFSPPTSPPYAPTSGFQIGVNNTGTDMCQQKHPTLSQKLFQVMTWDYVSQITPSLSSTVYVSFNLNDSPLNSVSFANAYDPDVAIWSDSNGTFVEIVFENNLTGQIDGYTYYYNTSTGVFDAWRPQKSVMRNDINKKAKNPNVAASKDKGRIAVVWHEEGLVVPGPQLSITYNTNPVQTFVNNISMLESKVYIYCVDKTLYTGELLGSPTGPIWQNPGRLIIRNLPPNTNNLFDRNFNPDVAISEDLYPTTTQAIISVAFLSEYFNPASFSIVSDALSVVQGTADDYRNYDAGVATLTNHFKRTYTGKPRIAARLNSSTNAARDFSVVMGAFVPGVGCPPPASTSKLHQWWYQTGAFSVPCLPGGVDLLSLSPFYANNVTTVDPVITCINNRGHYAVSFATNALTNNRYDIVANTYFQGTLLAGGNFSIVNAGTCSAYQTGNQVIPSIASIRKVGGSATLGDYTYNNHLFWDQTSRTLDYKKVTNQIIPGGGAQLRQMEGQSATADDQTKFTAYPNPTDSEISFDFKLDANEIASEIEIFNLSGQSVDKFAVTETATQKRAIDKMPSGVYIAILKTNLQNHRLQFIRK